MKWLPDKVRELATHQKSTKPPAPTPRPAPPEPVQLVVDRVRTGVVAPEIVEPLVRLEDRFDLVMEALRQIGEQLELPMVALEHLNEKKTPTTPRVYYVQLGSNTSGMVLTARRFPQRYRLDPDGETFKKSERSVLEGTVVHMVYINGARQRLELKRLGSLAFLSPYGLTDIFDELHRHVMTSPMAIREKLEDSRTQRPRVN